MIRWLVSLLLLRCLTLLAATASAECAWVLWEEVTLLRPDEHGSGAGTKALTPSGGYVGYAVCEGASSGSSDAILSALQEGKFDTAKVVRSFKRYEPSTSITVQYTDGSRRMLNWICLPDTVDPRGVKGK